MIHPSQPYGFSLPNYRYTIRDELSPDVRQMFLRHRSLPHVDASLLVLG